MKTKSFSVVGETPFKLYEPRATTAETVSSGSSAAYSVNAYGGYAYVPRQWTPFISATLNARSTATFHVLMDPTVRAYLYTPSIAFLV
jgi:hypothetical protein